MLPTRELGMNSVQRRATNGSESKVFFFVLAAPVYLYIASAWIIRPLSFNNIALAYAVPLLFSVGLLVFAVPKSVVVKMLGKVKIELGLALVMALLSILSVFNSEDPIRILRILFPSALPLLLFLQLVALKYIAPATVERLPRVFFAAGIVFACLPLLLTLISGGAHDYFFQDGYRYMGMFDHESQLSVMIAVLVPLAIAEIAIAESPLRRWAWVLLLVLVFYTLVRVGSKTAIFITLAYSWLFYILTHLRFQSYLKNVFLISVIAVLMLFTAIYGTSLATAIDPILGAKIAAVFDDGIENYRTIQSRSELWSEALSQGKKHWLVGTGAGEMILGMQHAHNLVLDYFRGIGIFGAFAIVLLCLRILWRATGRAFSVLLAEQVTPTELRIFACYASAAVYVICNQLSNSFGPATISALWMIYLPAVLSEQHASHRVPGGFALRPSADVG